MNKETLDEIIRTFGVIIALFMVVIIGYASFYVGERIITNMDHAYYVFLDNKKIGKIESIEEFEEILETYSAQTKEELKVEDVYYPDTLEIIKKTNFFDNYDNPEDVFEIVLRDSSFWIDGYTVFIEEGDTKAMKDIIDEGDSEIISEEVTISPDENTGGEAGGLAESDVDSNMEYQEEIPEEEKEVTEINILHEEDLSAAIEDVIKVFVGDDEYEKISNGIPVEMEEEYGVIIEEFYVENKVEILPAKVPVDGLISDEHTLSYYLLYGNLEPTDTYTVQFGETVADVAEINQINTQELLAVNDNLVDEHTLLAEGDVLNVGIISPVINVIVEKHFVEERVLVYETEFIEDETVYESQDYKSQTGVNGTEKVTYKLQELNGERVTSRSIDRETIVEPINEIWVVGTKYAPSVGGYNNWMYPASGSWYISSYYGWRSLGFHTGVDFAGSGYNSPIYAANNGVVTGVYYNYYTYGTTVIVDHNNGYVSLYAHLSSPAVKVGTIVPRGTVIGYMGNTGNVYPRPSSYNPTAGTHLHFEIHKNGSRINPLSVY